MEENMIAKELDGYNGDDKLIKAGHEAEKQIAHYLLRQYHNTEDVFVINTLRFSWLDGYTQIDHLVLHRFGLIIIESKSVSSKVKYNEREEWNRLWNNHWDKMENPVKQARRQAKAIKDLLRDNAARLRGKVLGLMQLGFKNMQIDCLVAISDQCIGIQRPSKDPYLNIVVKADLITDQVDKIIDTYKKNNGIFAKGEPPWSINREELVKVKDFLLSSHVPVVYEKPTPLPEQKAPAKAPQPVKTVVKAQPETTSSEKITSLTCCEECGGKVVIVWGEKYKNYYWHCNACGKNFPIKHSCPSCREKLRIRKRKHEFFIYCDPCRLEALYYSEEP